MKKKSNGFGGWIIRFRWLLILVTLVTVSITAGGTQFLTFNNDVRMYFSEVNPQLQALEALENTYSKDENVLFVLAPKSGDVFTKKTLQALTELTEASWQIPYSTRVDSLTNFQHTRAAEDELIVEDLIQDPENLSGADLERIRKIATEEPVLINRVISPSSHVTSVNILVTKPGNSQKETDEIAAYARAMVTEFEERYPGIDFHLSGGIIIDAAFGEASQDDMKTLVPLMYLVLFIIMGISLRSLTGTFAAFLVIVFSMLTAIGLAGWFGIKLSPSSVNAPTIILTLAVADSIHLLVTILQLMRQGMAKHDAISESLRINLGPVFVTSVTTAVGFLSMNFSDAPPFHDLGNIVAMGVVAALIYSIFFLPALMAVLPLRVKAVDSTQCHFCEWLADYIIKRKKPLFWALILIISILTSGVLRIELNDDFVKYFDDRYSFRRDTDFIERNLTGFNVIEYSLSAGETGGINEPTFLNTVDNFVEWYRQQPKVVHVFTLTDTMKRLNKNMHGDDESFYSLPQERNLAAQYLLLYEMSLPFGLDLNKEINVDKSAIRLVVRMKEASTRELRDMDDRALEWLREHAPENMFTRGSGMSMMFAHISERNIKSMLGASFGALVIISLILVFSLRSIKFGFMSLIPNLAPAFMAFGLWGLTVGQVGLVISILAALTLGIVVDDTVHFMSKYLRARREYKMDPAEAVRYSFHTVGTAMMVTTVVLVAGFMVLSFSGFELNADMGLMTALTIILALVLDFFFLPVLLMKMEE